MGLTKTNMNFQYAINVVNLIGLSISIYALIVEFYKDADPSYKPMCDISERVSCSKSLMSDYGRGFGFVGRYFGKDHPLNLRNPIFGIVFYILMMVLASFNSVFTAKLFYWLAVFSNVFSIYLAYVMYRFIQSVCIVCCSLYAVNFVLLGLGYYRLGVVKQMARKKRD